MKLLGEIEQTPEQKIVLLQSLINCQIEQLKIKIRDIEINLAKIESIFPTIKDEHEKTSSNFQAKDEKMGKKQSYAPDMGMLDSKRT